MEKESSATADVTGSLLSFSFHVMTISFLLDFLREPEFLNDPEDFLLICFLSLILYKGRMQKAARKWGTEREIREGVMKYEI